MKRLDDRVTYFIAVRRGRSKRIHAVKIGLTSRAQVKRRLANLQTGSPDRLEVLAVVSGNVEKKFKRQWKGYHLRGEFFKPAPELMKMIDAYRQMAELVERLEAQQIEKAA